MKRNLEFENIANEDMNLFFIPNGKDESDTISEVVKNIPDIETEKEGDIQNYDFFKDIQVNDTEYNNNALGKSMNNVSQSQASDEKIISFKQLILKTVTSAERPQELNKKSDRRNYFQKYNYKFRKFITKYANNLLRKHLLCGKIQNPRISILKFFIKKKNKNKFSSLTMKKMFCFNKRENKKIIKRILSFIQKFDSKKKYEYITYFLSLEIEEAIKKFEESETFKEFISDKEIISLDKKIQLEEGFSILQKNAYAKMIKIQREM